MVGSDSHGIKSRIDVIDIPNYANLEINLVSKVRFGMEQSVMSELGRLVDVRDVCHFFNNLLTFLFV